MKPHLTAFSTGLFPALLLLLAGPLPATVQAADAHDAHHAHAGHGMPPPSANANATASTQRVEGQVKKIDKAGGKVTVTHGPLTNLDMPAMTMVFRVKESAWLEQLKPEQKIRFVADSINGVLTIIRLEVAK
jgi:Cu(I)/Ag(I) efflux system protein CusF